MTSKSDHMAVLIDGDNAQPSLIDQVMVEISKHGDIKTARVYGNWQSANMSGWKKAIQTHSIQARQHFPNAIGKNATDIALVIDAMDLLHDGIADGICIVSSDSDYTALAMRVRDAGRFVMGVGRKDTPPSFVNSCEVFVRTESLGQFSKPTQKFVPKRQASRSVTTPSSNWLKTVQLAIDQSKSVNGWVLLAEVGSAARKIDPNFNYPGKLLAQIRKHPKLFETKGSNHVRNLKSGQGSVAPSLNGWAETIHRAIGLSAGSDGWVHLASVGQQALKIDHQFKSKHSGKLTALIKSRPDVFELRGTKSVRIKS